MLWPIIDRLEIQSGTERTLFATWVWYERNTDHYEVKWTYTTEDKDIEFEGTETTSDINQCLYNAPSNAKTVSVTVRPIAETHTVNGSNYSSQVPYWTACWSNKRTFDFENAPLPAPKAPTVKIDGYKMTVELQNLDSKIQDVNFQVAKSNGELYQSIDCFGITNGMAVSSITVAAGFEYKARARVRKKTGEYSSWSEYSGNVGTPPEPVKDVSYLRALSATSVYVKWDPVSSAKKYKVEYTTDKEYFDSSSEPKTLTVEATVQHAEVTGLESGREWFFRVKSVNDKGDATASAVRSIKIGSPPSPPTTWSSTTTAVVGENINLYWAHNAEDESSQTYAELELVVGGVSEVRTIRNTADEDLKDKTSVYTLHTSSYSEGTRILWRVRTKGVIDTYGEWSVQREIDVYAPPSISMTMTDVDGNVIDKLRVFPFYITASAGPRTQTPVGYHVYITSNKSYETVDNMGNSKLVSVGEEVFERYYDTSDAIRAQISANDVSFENNMEYVVHCIVLMDSGLTAEAAWRFTVMWDAEVYLPNIEIGYNDTNYTTMLRPYCDDRNGRIIEGLLLSVYRREMDGSFTELATNLRNEDAVFITDPHPALDYARYRITARDMSTGVVSFYDAPGYPIHESAVIIQWDEAWSSFDSTTEAPYAEPLWAGSLIRLPGNINVSDKHDPDVSLVKYIGRKHPVSYYGTQIGAKSTWTVDIDKRDKETLYSLRRLAYWMGDVYVREPSGSGYWANVTVSFNQKHLATVIPVTFDIVRVSGGA